MITKPTSCHGCPLYEKPFGSHYGWVGADGTGSSGVLIVAEAAGGEEEKAGIPLIGPAGHFLFTQLSRIGLERDDFRIHNILSCRPPGNKLVKMPYEQECISHCHPNLLSTIEDMRERCAKAGKHFTILTLGRVAFKAIMGLSEKDAMMRNSYQCYPHWNADLGAFVVAADHPAYLMRGKSALIPVLQFAAKRAVEIAKHGLEIEDPQHLCDPSPETFYQWVTDYLDEYCRNPDSTYLTYDIETPYKSGKDEEAVSREEDDDYTILRCSFSYRPGEAVSVPWNAAYMPMLERIFASPGQKVAWNENYDLPRIAAQIPFEGAHLDAMLAWHVLNSSLPKGLGFVTPFYCQEKGVWKHLSEAQPALYNAIDSDVTLRNFLGIKRDLERNDLWHVFDRHVVKLNEVLSYMSKKGVLRDEIGRSKAEKRLQTILNTTHKEIQTVVPDAVKETSPKDGYKRDPDDTTGLERIRVEATVARCSACGALSPTKPHFKTYKRPTTDRPQNPCAGATKVERVELVERWAKRLPFRLSSTSLKRYQKSAGHKAHYNWKEKKVTFDETALKHLMKRYPKDGLYPLIGKYRGAQKLLSTNIGRTSDNGVIIGGMTVGNDGRIHTLFTHTPSTLRLASQQPNLQNLPRPGGEDDLASLVRNLIIAAPGHTLLARDYSGIEALLVGYEARSPTYMRLCKIDIHSFYTAYCLYQYAGVLKAGDLPEAGWSDDKLKDHLAWIKKDFKKERNGLYKHLVHAINFGQGPKGAQEKIYKETDVLQPLAQIREVMGIYRDLFPEISRWQTAVQLQADRDGYLRNAFGYLHRFNRVFSWSKESGKWARKPGDDAQRVLAFRPQSNAAGVIKEALLRLYFQRFQEAGQYLRLQVHDEILLEVPETLVEEVDEVVKEEMEKPIPELALPKSYGMGEYLMVGTEAKMGKRWGGMQ